MTTIAFDVDDTLIVPACATDWGKDTYHGPVLDILKSLKYLGNTIIVWSGGGADYAKRRCNEFNIPYDIVADKNKQAAEAYGVDITFDDQDVKLGKVNIKVPRVNNKINRKEAQGGLTMAEFYRKQERKEI